MKIIDRYVIRQMLPPILLALLVFTFVLISSQIKEHAESFIANGVWTGLVMTAMWLLVPQALALTIPMSLLLGLLIAFTRLSADREFVAMQACGMSLARLLRPVGLLSVLFAGATFYIWAIVVPDSNQRFREIAFNVVAQSAEYKVRSRVFFDDFPNIVLYVREIPVAGAPWGSARCSVRGRRSTSGQSSCPTAISGFVKLRSMSSRRAPSTRSVPASSSMTSPISSCMSERFPWPAAGGMASSSPIRG